ncbi:CHAT domain-containing protein [[Phormidium] sp. ETS-05]|uniref:CHAT domain-containing protein n=1 Tax=[Phormidium] sp. ETS-05 TaxID=222819 RepID=UPI0018EF3581|nr:CHAT domain-containing protein [[Phormidium] sp. ETS-05]
MKKIVDISAILVLLSLVGKIDGAAAIAPRDFNTGLGREIVSLSENSVAEASLWEIGLQLYEEQRFAEAVQTWEKLRLQPDLSHPEKAVICSYLALAYRQLGNYEAAEAMVNQGLSLVGEISGENNPEIMARLHNSRGHLMLAMGNATAALSSWQQAEANYRLAGDELGAIGTLLNQAQALQSLGLYRRDRSTLESVASQLKAQPDSGIKATGLRSLGNIYRAIGELDKSTETLQESLAVAERLKSPEAIAAAQLGLGNTATDIYKIAKNLNDTPRQNAALKTGINAYETAANTTANVNQKVEAWLNHIKLLLAAQLREDAAKLAAEILPKMDNLPASRRTVYGIINLTDSLKILGHNQEQIAGLLAQAVQQAASLGDVRAESYALGSLGRLYQEAGQLKDARKLMETALFQAESINASDIAYQWHWQLGRLFSRQGNRADAISAYNEAILDLENLRKDLTTINTEVQFSFRESVEPVYRELVSVLLQSPNQTNLNQARQVIESLQVAELQNFFQEACLDARVANIDEVDKNAAIIYPIILPDSLEIILALPRQPLRHYRSAVAAREIETTAAQLRRNLGRVTGSKTEVLRLSQVIYNWMMQPAAADIAASGVKTLVFVPDGVLRNLPMGVLYDGEKYLIENYNIALSPGSQLIDPQPLKAQKLQVLAAGLSEARQGFSPLPEVAQELADIKQQLGAKLLLNQDFTSQSFRTALEKKPFMAVHIATHGQFSSRAENTFILTYDGVINVQDWDNFLRLGAERLNQPIELLVLSACETAAGDNRAALGLAGVAVRAGARSTLATLWKVSDKSTAALMDSFYRELGQGKTKAEALRLAQLELLQQGQYALPYFWASYVMVGNWL